MKLQKQLVASLAGAAFFGSVVNAEIPLTDDLSAYGYIDLAYTDLDDDSNLEGGAAEFELGFAFSPVDSPWSAVAELSFLGTGNFAGGEDVETQWETLTITYAASDELSFTLGNILSYQGFETYDATGLFQYSAQGWDGTGHAYVYSAAYAYGASADYVTDDFAAGLWIGESDDSLSYEVLLAYTGIDGLTAKAIYADDPGYETINLWASYDIDAFTFAVEYTGTDYTGGAELDAYMALAYYAFGDAGVTVRYSDVDDGGYEYEKYTFSPSYAFSDSVFGLLEVSYIEDNADEDFTTFAAELIFSF
ncbi:hypothetical protein SH580_13750 [Coraliomargarita algicola]|uniref:Porin domain-containing protein n=1 Tax=Coraliomargarita algicola TaxID=3092156 RepID=A0ABZ0RHJ9_9BACT|nr:hypothetical protein [Coraliomargarita sp. J2-16]WPJ94495.1 hypothetical protein SH580_13750 [Coraliomargarita sp. J2-16]